MVETSSRPFSSGTEYEVFLDNYCFQCKMFKWDEERKFPAFPEDGGCRILDLMERARFHIELFPSKKIVYQDGKRVCKDYIDESFPFEPIPIIKGQMMLEM